MARGQPGFPLWVALLAEVKPAVSSSNITHVLLSALGWWREKLGLDEAACPLPAFLEKKLCKPLGPSIVGSNALETVGGSCVPTLCMTGKPHQKVMDQLDWG